MRAKMIIQAVTIKNNTIQEYGSVATGTTGHNYVFEAQVRVQPRSVGPLSGEGVDCPTLQWNERIEWFAYNQHNNSWYFVGQNPKDMYAFNPASNTFQAWHSMRFQYATLPMNAAPAGLAACGNDTAAKHWIAKNGFAWKIQIQDTPGMGLTGGVGGGGGASLVTGDTRRRVIYFDLGFTGAAVRCKFVQILETVQGNLTIQKFINQDVAKGAVDDANNLARWRGQLGQNPPSWLP